MINVDNKKGFILVTAYMVVAVLVILATSFSARSIGEKRVADKERDTSQALWLAEAGVDRAMAELPDSPLSGTLGTGAYNTQTTQLTSTQYLINSTGGVPGTSLIDPSNAIRKVSVIVERPLNLNGPGEINSAITATGNVVLKGNAKVNGVVDEYAVFDFEEIFGISKEAMRNGATRIYIDPENSIMPVDQCTWVDLVAETEMNINAGPWTGSGILVVNGDLVITGGVFNGIIWVIGALRVAGNPTINGAIFVESGASVQSSAEITGTPVLSYDGDAVDGSLIFVPSESGLQLMSWKED